MTYVFKCRHLAFYVDLIFLHSLHNENINSNMNKYWPPATIWRLCQRFHYLKANGIGQDSPNELSSASPWGVQGQLMAVICLEADTCRHLDFSSLYSAISPDICFVEIIFFLMLICKYILLYLGNAFDTRNNFTWSTNCETCRNYCLMS